MTKATSVGVAVVLVLVVLGLAAAYRTLERDAEPPAATGPVLAPATSAAAEADPQGFLYGRVTTFGGATHEGRLRWGDGAEAFWGDFFNGRRDENPWVAHVPPERLPRERKPIEIFGFELAVRERPAELRRLFLARFGDLTRIEASGGDVRVTWKSGTVVDLDRLSASDFDDGVRVWDGRGGAIDLDSSLIRTIELLPAPHLESVPSRLHGTVRTRQGELAGFLQWDRQEGVGSDALDGRTAAGPVRLRFDTIRSIARLPRDGSLVTLVDGRQVELSGTGKVGQGHRGTYVDDPRYGRVLVSWDAFERVDFSPGGSGPAYDDFPPGQPLRGSVSTRDGRRFAGRMVYDLDESETTETLDAPSRGLDYTIPFGLIASIVLPDREERDDPLAGVTLHSGEALRLELGGDLGERNAGLLVFVDDGRRPEYVPWSDVGEVRLERPPAMYPPPGGR